MPDTERDSIFESHPQQLLDNAVSNIQKRQSSSGEFDVMHVRRVVAGNPNTPSKVLERLADDQIPLIRRNVAGNPKSPVVVLQKLALDGHADVRIAVAENINTPSEILAILANDEDLDVRYGVAENPHMPENILLELSQDENPYVRARALKTMQMLAPEVQSRLLIMLQQAAKGIEKEHGANFY